MRKIGVVNLPDLRKLLWKAVDHFVPFQNYLRNLTLESFQSSRTPGLVYGGEVVIESALTVRVKAGFAIFPDLNVATWEDILKTLPPADVAHPRIDRVELQFKVKDGFEVVTTDSLTRVFDKEHTVEVVVNSGVPGAIPAANAKAPANISAALVRVNAGAAILFAEDIDTSEDSAAELSSLKTDSGPAKIRYSRTKGLWEYTNDGVIWAPVGSGGGGGGAGANWVPFATQGPVTDFEFDEKTLRFEQGKLQKAILLVKVPTGYVAGRPASLRLGHFAESLATKFKFQVTCTLIRKNVDALNSVVNQAISNSGDITTAVANQFRECQFALTDVDGKVNGISLSGGDLLKLELQRIPPADSEDAADVRMIPSCTEVLFS